MKLTHPDRVLWPDVGVTKQGLADFYAEIWPWIAPHVVDRPLALVRCPGGVEESCFFQKHAWAGISEHIIRARDPDGGEELLAIKDVEGLLSLVQASVLEIHVWGAKLDNIEKPDGITFDLDPDAAVAWPDVVAAAFEVRDRLNEAGLSSFVKTTGGKGLHVYAPLKPHADWAAVKEFAHALAKAMAKDSPRKYLATASKTGPQRTHLRRLSAQRPRRHGGRRLFGAGAGRRHRVDAARLGRTGARHPFRSVHHFKSAAPPFARRRSLEGRAQSRQALAVQAPLRAGTMHGLKRCQDMPTLSSTTRELLNGNRYRSPQSPAHIE